MSFYYAPQDRRHPILMDWLLAVFFPLEVIAYHHSRAGLTYTHVFTLLAVWLVSFLTTLTLMGLLAKDFFESIFQLAPSTGASVIKRIQDGMESLGDLPLEERTARIQAIMEHLSTKSTIVSALMRLSNYFGYFMIGLAFYVVYKARKTTNKAKEEMMTAALSGQAPISHPDLQTPKGSGPAWMAYTVAVMSPSVSYAVNSDRRLVYFGVAMEHALCLSMAIVPGVFGAGLRFAPGFGIDDAELVELMAAVSARLLTISAVMFVLVLLGPIRRAVLNVREARRKYSQDELF